MSRVTWHITMITNNCGRAQRRAALRSARVKSSGVNIFQRDGFFSVGRFWQTFSLLKNRYPYQNCCFGNMVGTGHNTILMRIFLSKRLHETGTRSQEAGFTQPLREKYAPPSNIDRKWRISLMYFSAFTDWKPLQCPAGIVIVRNMLMGGWRRCQGGWPGRARAGKLVCAFCRNRNSLVLGFQDVAVLMVFGDCLWMMVLFYL